jgi:hypothetical protein
VRDSVAISGLLAWPGISEVGFGWKVRSAGAVPAGRVCALNSGAASLPTFTPGACWAVLVCWKGCREDKRKRAYAFGGEGF